MREKKKGEGDRHVRARTLHIECEHACPEILSRGLPWQMGRIRIGPTATPAICLTLAGLSAYQLGTGVLRDPGSGRGYPPALATSRHHSKVHVAALQLLSLIDCLH